MDARRVRVAHTLRIGHLVQAAPRSALAPEKLKESAMPDETMEEAAAPEPIVFGTLEKTAQQADGVAEGVSRGHINKADDSQHMALTAVRARAMRVVCLVRRARAPACG
jgi:hypothetical protein